MEYISASLAFILGGVFFWPVVLGLAVLSWFLVEKKHEFWSVLFFGLLAYLLIERWEPLKAVLQPWYVAGFEIGTVSKIVMYGIMGVIWSFVYWVLINRHNSQVFRELKERVLKEYNLPLNAFSLDYTSQMVSENAAWFHNDSLQDILRRGSFSVAQFNSAPVEVGPWIRAAQKLNVLMMQAPFQFVRVHGFMPSELLESVKPRASNMSSTIAAWIIYWPFSMVWFLIRDFTVQFAEFAVRNLGRSFQRITASIFRDSL